MLSLPFLGGASATAPSGTRSGEGGGCGPVVDCCRHCSTKLFFLVWVWLAFCSSYFTSCRGSTLPCVPTRFFFPSLLLVICAPSCSFFFSSGRKRLRTCKLRFLFSCFVSPFCLFYVSYFFLPRRRRDGSRRTGVGRRRASLTENQITPIPCVRLLREGRKGVGKGGGTGSCSKDSRDPFRRSEPDQSPRPLLANRLLVFCSTISKSEFPPRLPQPPLPLRSGSLPGSSVDRKASTESLTVQRSFNAAFSLTASPPPPPPHASRRVALHTPPSQRTTT